MAVKSKKVPGGAAANKKPEPVQMMAQTPYVDKNQKSAKQPIVEDWRNRTAPFGNVESFTEVKTAQSKKR